MEQDYQRLNDRFLGMADEDVREVDIRGAEVVRRQFLSHMKESMVTFRPNGLQFNTYCISGFTDVTHVLLMVDWEKGWFIIKPCDPDDRDGQRWCNVKGTERKSRFITGKPLQKDCTRNSAGASERAIRFAELMPVNWISMMRSSWCLSSKMQRITCLQGNQESLQELTTPNSAQKTSLSSKSLKNRRSLKSRNGKLRKQKDGSINGQEERRVTSQRSGRILLA